MKKTAQEILNNHLTCGENTYLAGQGNNILKAMEEYAKQENQNSEQISVERLVRRQIADECLAKIPTSWLDSLLTGENNVIGKYPWGCPQIESLLNAIRKRIDEVGNLSA